MEDPLPNSNLWLLTTDFSFSPHETFHRADRNMAFLKESDEREKERDREEWKLYHFNDCLQVTHHHFCLILFIRSKSLGPARLKGRE